MNTGSTLAQRARPAGQHSDIISVQSQVIYGSVGNSVAVPALGRYGWRVLAVPTFLLSNTPDYPSFYGGEIPQAWFSGFLQGLHERGQDRQLCAVITGYLGSTAKAEALSRWLQTVTAANPQALVVVDPVLGDDDGGFYVDPALVGWYRDHLLPLATGLTPNHFELSSLTGKTLCCEQEVVDAARLLLSERTRWVAVTSASRGQNGKTLRVVCVTATSATFVEHAAHEQAPKGTGDLFTAELTAALLEGIALELAVERACERTRLCVVQAMESGSGVLDPRALELCGTAVDKQFATVDVAAVVRGEE